jgi:TolB protein
MSVARVLPALISLCALSTPAWADPDTDELDSSLHVIVGPGARSLEPMAVPDTLCFGASSAVCNTAAEVLRRDMLLSFFFNVLPPRSYLVDPSAETVDEPKFNDWTNTGARFLIKSRIDGPAPYKVELRLFNVTSRTLMPVAGQTHRDVREKDLRRIVHQFANGVLQAITGTPGVFDTRIAFSSKVGPGVKAIGIMDMDGFNRGGLVSNGSINMLPSWGFGGVLYTSFLAGKPDIYFGKKKLSSDQGHYRKVAVSRDGGSLVASIAYGGQSDLFLLAKDGSVIRNLTNSDADEVSPTFSPDGSKIAFVSSAAGGPQVYVMSVGGGGQQRVTFAGDYNFAPDWGPDGKIAFAAMDGSASDIFTVTEGGGIERLTQDQGVNKDPTWSPDGRYLAFISSRPAGSGVYLMSADGRYQLLVSKGGGLGNTAWER